MVVRFSFGFAGFESSSPDVVAAAATQQQSLCVQPDDAAGWRRAPRPQLRRTSGPS
jgi:hypothetical protein